MCVFVHVDGRGEEGGGDLLRWREIGNIPTSSPRRGGTWTQSLFSADVAAPERRRRRNWSRDAPTQYGSELTVDSTYFQWFLVGASVLTCPRVRDAKSGSLQALKAGSSPDREFCAEMGAQWRPVPFGSLRSGF